MATSRRSLGGAAYGQIRVSKGSLSFAQCSKHSQNEYPQPLNVRSPLVKLIKFQNVSTAIELLGPERTH